MLTQQTVDRLTSLRLHGLRQGYEEQLNSGDVAHLGFDDRFGLLVERQWLLREERRTNKLLKSAQLKQPACVEDVECDSSRGLDREVLRELSSCRWVKSNRNLLITGPTGTGKTWLACALSQAACRLGMTALYQRVPRLAHELSLARLNGSYLKLLSKLAKVDLLVLDDLGLSTLESEAQLTLLEIIDDRSSRATLVTSQLPVDKWYGTFTDPTVADALLDRLLGQSQQVRLKGGTRRGKSNRPESDTNKKGVKAEI